MQWLIDLVAARVIETIGIPPVYRDRGNYATTDFVLGDLIVGMAWHELDLSDIIEENATAVAIRIKAISNDVGSTFRLRKHSTTSNAFTCVLSSQVGGVYTRSNPVIGVSTDRKIDYMLCPGDWTSFDMVIRGWWL